MNVNNYIRISVLSLMLILGTVPGAQAQFPTLDISAITQGVKGVVQQVNQIKTQIMESSVVGSINSAIGDAKSAMSKFSLDEIKAKAKEAEKKLKEANKIKKIAEDIKKAKAAYEQKKQQFDDYKKRLADAKSKVTAKVNEAKSKIDEAKDKVESKVSDAMAKVNDVKSNVTSKVNEAKAKVDEAKSKVNDVKSNVTSKVNDAKAKVDEAKSKVNDIKSNVTSKVGNVVTKVNDAKSNIATKVDNAKSQVNNIKSNVTTKASNAISKANSIKNDITTTVAEVNSKLDNAKSGIADSIDAVVPKAKVGDSASLSNGAEQTSGARKAFTISSPDFEKSEILTANASVNTPQAKSSVAKAKEISATEGITSGVQAINTSLRKAMDEKDTKTLEEIANIDPADIINSDSKIYDDGTTPTLKGRLDTTITEDKLLAPTKTINKNSDVKLQTEKAAALPNKAVTDVKENTKPSISLDEKTDIITTKPVVNSGKTLTETISAKTTTPLLSKTPTNTNKESVSSNGLKVNRQKFQTQPLLQKNSYKLWLDDGDHSRHHGIKLSFNDTLKFGSAECDYNNSIISGDDGEVVILSEMFAKECCLKPEELKDLSVIRDCARNLIKKMNDPDSIIAAEAQSVFQQISAEQLKYGLAEALDNTNDSTSYLKDVLEQYKKDMTQSSNTKDDISIVTMTNTQLLYLFNRCLVIIITLLYSNIYFFTKDIIFYRIYRINTSGS